MAERLVNPIASFYLEGNPDEPEIVIAITDLFGESGQKVEIAFTDPGYVKSIAEMLNSCVYDFNDAMENGIMNVVERKGMQSDKDVTIDDLFYGDDDND